MVAVHDEPGVRGHHPEIDDPGHLPAAVTTPAEFEQFVVDMFRAAEPDVGPVKVTLHDRIEGVDGVYDVDGSVRFRHLGMDFVVLIEAKMHAHPIKREVVQILHQKVQSVGAHKGVVVSTARFQRGALEFAKVHGVALVEVTEGRFTWLERSGSATAPITQEEAIRRGIEPLAGQAYTAGDGDGSTSVTLVSPECGDHVAELLLGVDPLARS